MLSYSIKAKNIEMILILHVFVVKYTLASNHLGLYLDKSTLHQVLSTRTVVSLEAL
jgi:hypothetical protein